MKLFECQNCGQLLYFENRTCQNCSHQLGFLPGPAELVALEPEGDVWKPLGSTDVQQRFCANAKYDACNWLVPADSQEDFCTACRHNRTIPDLNIDVNLTRWRRFELAKHRLFYSLMRLGLPIPNRADEPVTGLVFDFLADIPGGAKVMTGHEDGLITINLREADDVEREAIRNRLSEPYRTLLGHFRHESGHYYWERLVQGTDRMEAFRDLFGDERQDYQGALQANYSSGPALTWQESHISSYAACHPWEDFAETWAHYLHIVDTLETAFSFGIRVRPKVHNNSDLSVVVNFDPHETGDVNRLIDAWLPLTFAVNSMNRSMGGTDLYPFLLSPGVIRKLGFMHDLVHARA